MKDGSSIYVYSAAWCFLNLVLPNMKWQPSRILEILNLKTKKRGRVPRNQPITSPTSESQKPRWKSSVARRRSDYKQTRKNQANLSLTLLQFWHSKLSILRMINTSIKTLKNVFLKINYLKKKILTQSFKIESSRKR